MIDKSLSKNLETVRGLAAFIVLLAHTSQWFVTPLVGIDHPGIFAIRHAAHFSVLIFFALSGFVITNSLVLNKERNGYIDSFSYIKSRIVRIVPPGVAACLFALAVAVIILALDLHGSETFRTDYDLYVAREQITLRWQNVVASFLLSNGVVPGTGPIITNGPLWSLSIEFWIYFVALLVAIALSGISSSDSILRNSGLVSAIAILMLLGFTIGRPFDLMQYVFYWLLGSLLFARTKFPALVRYLFLSVFLCGILALIIFALKPTSWSIDLITGKGLPGLAGIALKGSILIALASLMPFISCLPFRRFFASLAPSSYTLYVFHFPILCLLFSLFHLSYLGWSIPLKVTFLILVIIATLISCHILAKFLEDRKTWSKCFSWVGDQIAKSATRFKKIYK